MSSRLDRITNLEERARIADYRVGELAVDCGVSQGHMSRYLRGKFHCPAHVWLRKLQLQLAEPGLAVGKLVKQVYEDAGYAQPSNFSRAFKRFYGVSPTSFQP